MRFLNRAGSRLRFHRHPATLILLLAAAAVLRITGIFQDFDAQGKLAGIWHYDEFGVIFHAFRLDSVQLNPDYWGYPALHLYLLAFLNGLLAHLQNLWNLLAGRPFVSPDMDSLYRIGRMVSVTADLCCIGLLYRFTRSLYDRRTAFWAALLLAINPLAVIHSHYATLDATLTLLCLVSVVFITQSYQEGSRRAYLLAGLFIGLATAQKYNAFVLAPAFLAAHLLRHRSLREAAADTKWVAALAVTAGVFLLVNLNALFHASDALAQFADNFRKVVAYPGERATLAGGMAVNYAFLWQAAGPLIFLALAGAALQLYRDPRKGLVLLIFPILFFLFMSGVRVRVYRYLLPLMPVLSLLAAHFLETLRSRSAWRGANILRWVLIVWAVVFLGRTTWEPLQILATEDTRQAMAQWVHEHVPPGSTVLVEGHRDAGPSLNPNRVRVLDRRRENLRFYATLQDCLDRNATYYIASSRFREDEALKMMQTFPIVQELEDDPRVSRVHVTSGRRSPLLPHRNPTLVAYRIEIDSRPRLPDRQVDAGAEAQGFVGDLGGPGPDGD